MGVKERDHQRFVKNLDRSKDAVFDIAMYYHKHGIPVTISPTSVSKGYKDRLKHTDNGDLYISQRIEVKDVSAQFTCEKDWPYKNSFIVCAKHSWDNAFPKPHSYIIRARDKKHIAVVYGSTHKKWTVKKIRDKRYEDMVQLFYICPTNLIKWSQL